MRPHRRSVASAAGLMTRQRKATAREVRRVFSTVVTYRGPRYFSDRPFTMRRTRTLRHGRTQWRRYTLSGSVIMVQIGGNKNVAGPAIETYTLCATSRVCCSPRRPSVRASELLRSKPISFIYYRAGFGRVSGRVCPRVGGGCSPFLVIIDLVVEQLCPLCTTTTTVTTTTVL